MHGRGLCNEARRDRNKGYVSAVKVVSFTERVVLTALHERSASVMKVGVAYAYRGN